MTDSLNHISDGHGLVAILSLLPPSGANDSTPAELMVINKVRARFQATGIDLGLIEASSAFEAAVAYQ